MRSIWYSLFLKSLNAKSVSISFTHLINWFTPSSFKELFNIIYLWVKLLTQIRKCRFSFRYLSWCRVNKFHSFFFPVTLSCRWLFDIKYFSFHHWSYFQWIVLWCFVLIFKLNVGLIFNSILLEKVIKWSVPSYAYLDKL